MGTQAEPITKAKIALRIGFFQWTKPERLQEILTYLKQHPGIVDEVALFDGYTHSAYPLALIQERAKVLAQVLPQFKALGITAGINHIVTIGHLDENLEHSLQEPWQHLMDASGTEAKGCFCYSDPRVKEYVRQSYLALANTQPDFIWFDDDLRLEGHGSLAMYPCFCDGCMKNFSQETGKAWTRESLRQAFNSGSAEESVALRQQWMEHLRKYQAGLLTVMRAAVDEVNPNLTLGFQTVEGAYSGYAMASCAEALAGSQDNPVMCRPGGGYYNDRIPLESLAKAHWTGRQVTFLPEKVHDIQYEHENFPYQVLKKSKTMFEDETGMAIAVGCTGALLNINFIDANPLSEYYPYLERLQSSRSFFDRAARTFGRSQNVGFWPAFTPNHSAALNPREDWFKAPLWGGDFAQFIELAENGLPMAYSEEGCRLAVLNATSVLDLPRPALMKVLSTGAMVDGPALAELERMGLGEFCGFKVKSTQALNTLEVFTDHPINGAFAHWQRDCRPAFTPDVAYLLEPLPGAQPLAHVVDFTGKDLGVSSGVFENSLGGRVAVMGYYAWTILQSLAKNTQIKSLFRWLSRDQIPGFVNSYASAALWARTDVHGQPAFLLVNTSLDPANSLELFALTQAHSLVYLRTDGSEVTLEPASQEGAYSCYQTPALKPWEMALITVK